MNSMKKFIIGFLGGLLLLGLGGGIAFAEFSAFAYAGSKTLSGQDWQTKTIETQVDTDGRPLVISYYAGDNGNEGTVQVIADASLAADTMVLEVAYQPNAATLHFAADRGVVESADGDDNDAEGGRRQGQQKDYYYISVLREPFAFLQYMDTVLQDVKNREFYDYRLETGGALVIRVAPENVHRVQK